MAELTVAGGLVLDVATRDDIAAHHDRLAKLIEGDTPRVLRFQRLAGGAPSAGATGAVIDLGAPPAGLVWKVQWITVFGATPFGPAIANVTAALMVGSLPSGIRNSGSVNNTDAILPALAVPSVTNLPDQVIVFPNEHLYVVLFGAGLGAGAPNYAANAGVTEVSDDGRGGFLSA